MKCYYLRNSKTLEVVTFRQDFTDDQLWVELDYDYCTPYFGDKGFLERVAKAESDGCWSIDICQVILKDAKNGLLEVVEVDL